MSKPLLSDTSLPRFVPDETTSVRPNLQAGYSVATVPLSIGRVVKRLFDVAIASVLLVMAIPVFIAVAALVAIDGGPIFFRHKRVGVGGSTFGCLKFRTMILGAEECLDEYLSHHPAAQLEWAQEQKLAFDPRITTIGRFLRMSSIDELPQLINVIKGDMSLVGPRPVTQGELVHYGFATPLYKSVRPGITGLWQVSGRNDVGYDKRVKLDEQYVRNWNFFVDFWILLRTPAVVLSRQGAR